MRRFSRYMDGAAVALAVHIGIFCAVTACLALGLYELMQPTRFANSGLAAYKPPPKTVMDLASPTTSAPLPDPLPTSIEPPLETIAASAPEHQSEADKSNTALKTRRPTRKSAARRKERRNPMTGYAFQRSFREYRSWWY